MSIKAMTWAFGLPLEPRAKIALLAIADNATDEGAAWPSLDTIAEKSSQSRATVVRRIKELCKIGVLAKKARYRPDGTQTTDLITLNFAVDPDLLQREAPDDGDNEAPAGEDAGQDGDDASASRLGYQPDTPPLQSCDPTPAVVTGGGLQSCHPQDEPSSEPRKIPPCPPEGGEDSEIEGTEERFEFFFTNCLFFRTQTRERPRAMFGKLPLADQIACAAASPAHAAELTRAKKKSLDAWKLIRDRYWTNYPNVRLPEKPADPIWIDEGPDIDALRVLAAIEDRSPPRLIHDDVKGSGMFVRRMAPPDLRALARFAGEDQLDWFVAEPDTREFNAWRHRLHDWTGQWCEPRIVMRRGFKKVAMLPGQPPIEVQNRTRGIPVPCRWPPKKDGTIYPDDPAAERPPPSPPPDETSFARSAEEGKEEIPDDLDHDDEEQQHG